MLAFVVKRSLKELLSSRLVPNCLVNIVSNNESKTIQIRNISSKTRKKCVFSQLYLPDVVVRAGVLGLLPREGTRILFLDVAFFCLSDVLGLRESPRDHQGGKKE